MEELRKQKENAEVVGDPALPPQLTRVLCKLDGENGTYDVSWKSSSPAQSYIVTLFRDKEPIASVTAVGTTGSISGAVSASAVYYIGVAPENNADVCTKVAVFSTQAVKIENIRMCEKTLMEVMYSFPGTVPDQLQVILENDELGISRRIKLLPYNSVIDLKAYGMSETESFRVSVEAEKWILDSDSGKVILDGGAGYQFYRQKPVIDKLQINAIKAEQMDISVFIGDAVFSAYAEAKLLLHTGKEKIWESEWCGKQEQQWNFSIPEEAFSYGRSTDFGCRFCLKNDVVYSVESNLLRLLQDVPCVEKIEYLSPEKVRLYFHNSYDFPHRLSVLGVEQNKTEEAIVLSAYQGKEIAELKLEQKVIKAAYCGGKTVGAYTQPISLEHSAYYLFDGNFMCICRSDNPVLNKEQDIDKKVSVSGTEIASLSGIFSLKPVEQEAVLHMDKKVWDFTDGAKRSWLKEELDDFLLKLEESGIFPADLEELRNIIIDYLPQSMEEFVWYHYGLSDNVVRLSKGDILRADFQNFQYVGDEVSSEFLNGYVSSGTREFPVLERAGKLSLDAFVPMLSNGIFVMEPDQPSGSGSTGLCAQGGGGMIDAMSSGMNEKYLALIYPDAFPHTDKEGMAETCKNPAILAADSLKTLEAGIKQFRSTGKSTVESIVTYLRGRTMLTPCMPIQIQGKWENWPDGTTLHDILSVYGMQSGSLKVWRKELPVYTFLTEDIEWTHRFLLYKGDRIVWE